jgi:hypothetical protein
MIKHEYKKRDVNRKHENTNDLEGKGWELVLLMPIPLRASLDALFTGYFKGSRFLNQTQLG